MKSIPLTQGGFALVDDEDYEYLNQWKWSCTKDGYAIRGTSVKGKKTCLYMHRVIMNAPKGLQVDHIDSNRINNQKKNLRLCTGNQNRMHRGLRRDNKSGYIGVKKYKRKRQWAAILTLMGKPVYIEYFDSPEEAARARDKEAKKYRGEFAKLNFPD